MFFWTNTANRRLEMAAIHQGPEVLEDLTRYAGSWVAIRDGKVVADALDSVELRNNPEVKEDDFLMPVPDAGAAAFLF
jgi:hypothetical protein